MTGRLLQGDHVDTPDGPGQIVAVFPTHAMQPATFYIVQLDDGRRPYQADKLVFVGRQLCIDDTKP